MKQSPDRLLQTWLHNADETTGAPNVIDTVHHEVHEGEMYHASYTASVANGANLDLLFTLASKEAHTVFEVFAGGQVTIYLYENPTATAAGTAVPVYNMKRSSMNTPGAAVTHTPTVTAVGHDGAGERSYLAGRQQPNNQSWWRCPAGRGMDSGANGDVPVARDQHER